MAKAYANATWVGYRYINDGHSNKGIMRVNSIWDEGRHMRVGYRPIAVFTTRGEAERWLYSRRAAK